MDTRYKQRINELEHDLASRIQTARDLKDSFSEDDFSNLNHGWICMQYGFIEGNITKMCELNGEYIGLTEEIFPYFGEFLSLIISISASLSEKIHPDIGRWN